MQFKLETQEHQRAAIQSVVEEPLYPSFGAPLVLLWSPYGESEIARNGFLDEPSGKAEREDGSKWYATGNTCSSVNEAGFVGLQTYVQKPMKLCSLRNNSRMQDTTITY